MINNEVTLLDRLNEVVDLVHIDEVKKIIRTLSKINKLKYALEENLSEDILYEKLSQELSKEFGISNLKITHTLGKTESTLYQTGDKNSAFTYIYKNKVSSTININIYLDVNHLDKYRILSLNTYFKEVIHLLYIQFVLLNVKVSSTIDPLTQLQTRISFNNEMKTLVPLAIREKMKFGVLLINIDRFRAINDEHGDEFGDDFLKLYAATIKNNIRTSDIAVRFSGGEFLVLLINVESEAMTIKIADKIRTKLADKYLLSPNKDRFKKTVCIGVSMFPEDSQDINEVIKYSEIALSNARDKGRNTTIRYQNEALHKIEFF